MRVKVRLFFHLRRHGPQGAGDFTLELPTGARVGQALEVLAIPLASPKVILLGGRQAGPEEEMHPDDELVIFPPVEGG